MPHGSVSFIPTFFKRFRPHGEIASLCVYLRQRERPVEYAAAIAEGSRRRTCNFTTFSPRWPATGMPITALYGVFDVTEIHGLGPSLALSSWGRPQRLHLLLAVP